MTQRESDEQRKLTRRKFIQYSAATSGVVLGAYAMTMKTDALAEQTPQLEFGDDDGVVSYSYR